MRLWRFPHHPAFVTGVFCAAGIWAYAPALHGAWLWDDASEITANPEITAPGGAARIWLHPSSSDYFPLKSTFLRCEHFLWGSPTVGYHLTALGLHLVCGLLLWRLLGKMLAGSAHAEGVAFFGALAFVLHPLATESVAWVAETKNPLSLAFLLAAAIAYLRFDRTRSASSYGVALAAFLAALLCKTTVAMFPAVILLHAAWRRGRVALSDAQAALPFAILSLALGLVTVWFQHHHVIEPLAMRPEPWAERIAAAGVAVWYYLGEALWPACLSANDPRWMFAHPGVPAALAWGATFALCAFAWIQRRRHGRAVLLGFGFFLVNLLPVLGLVPMAYQRIAWTADHLAYISLAGVAAGGALALFATAPRAAPWAAALACLALGTITHAYAASFASAETLWTVTLRRNPNAWFAAASLSALRSDQGRHGDALALAETAQRLHPDDAVVQSSYAVSLAFAGRMDAAIEHEQEAIRLRPVFPQAELNLGIFLDAAHRPAEAVPHYRAAESIGNRYPLVFEKLGNDLQLLGRPAEAQNAFARYRIATEAATRSR